MKAPPPSLHQDLQALHEALGARMRSEWQRDVPFTELLFDRWDRAETLRFGEGTSIYHNSYVYGNVEVGRHTWIGPFTLLDGTGGLTIGDYCSISAGVQLYSHDTVAWAVSGGKAPYAYRPVHIGHCCFIGPGSVVRAGVTVGDHSVIGAHSFVNRDVPGQSIVAGSPARLIGRVHLSEDDVTFEYFQTPVEASR